MDKRFVQDYSQKPTSKFRKYELLMRPPKSYPTVNNRSYDFVSCPIFHRVVLLFYFWQWRTIRLIDFERSFFLYLFHLVKKETQFWRTYNIIWQLDSNKIDKCHLQLMVKPQIFHRHKNWSNHFFYFPKYKEWKCVILSWSVWI